MRVSLTTDPGLSLPVIGDPNQLDPVIWPANLSRVADGSVNFAGMSVAALAERFGTPLYLVDEADARARAAEIVRAFTDAAQVIGTQAKLYYAGKAFLCSAIVDWISEAGLGIDVASGGELALALAAGAEPKKIGLHGNNKSTAEIAQAVGAGVGSIIIDSVHEIDRVAEAAAKAGVIQPVRLRVNSGVHAHTHEFLATAHEDQKFGVPLEQAVTLATQIRSYPALRFLGLHCHIGSQIFDAGGFVESASRLIAVHAELLADGDVPELNLGGGFGIAYTGADTPAPIAELAEHIMTVVAERCGAHGIPLPTLAFEPGRWIIGPPGVTLYRVGTVKPVPIDSGTRHYVSVDGGMSDNARPALYGADYTVRLVSRTSDAPPVLVRLAGKHCESGDIVVNSDYLPGDVAPGDLVAVAATGAYCWSLASNYNLVPRPAVVAVRDGTARVIVRGETVTDLLARDTGLADFSPEGQTR